MTAEALARKKGWIPLNDYYGQWGHACPSCVKKYGGDEERLKQAALVLAGDGS